MMMTLWFLYAIAVGTLACLAASAGERLLRLWRLPVRGVWGVAMILTLIVPVTALLSPVPSSAGAAAPAGAAMAGQLSVRVPSAIEVGLIDRLRLGAASLLQEGARVADRLAAATALLDLPLAAAWLAGSLLLAAVLLSSALRLRRRSRGWPSRTVDGVPVLVAPDAGPAVVGGGELRVVIPEWMLELDEPLRRLVLRHELEHIRAGDPRLLLAAVAATIAMPWNPALWWQLRRLRTAVELDCDRRVLRVHRDIERYGLLLLAVGQRAGAPLRLAVPALAESTGSLERRIAAMTAPRTARRDRLVRAALLAPLAASIAVAACMMPSPNSVAGPEPVPPVEQRTAPAPGPAQPHFEFQVEKPAAQLSGGAPAFPAELRAQGVSGTVVAQFVVDTNGVPETASFQVLESSHELFTAAVREALPGFRFSPAEVTGRRVRQLVQQPFVFRIDGGARQEVSAGVLRESTTEQRLEPLMRDGERTLAPTRAPDPSGRVPLRAGELRAATRAPAPTGERQRAYFEFEVEQPVQQQPGAAPQYPAQMRARQLSGEVIAEFVVDAAGRPDPATFRVLSSSHDAFAAAVREALSAMRFTPASIAGRAVPQVVQMPFVFEMK